jgi:hypothetical protein
MGSPVVSTLSNSNNFSKIASTLAVKVGKFPFTNTV